MATFSFQKFPPITVKARKKAMHFIFNETKRHLNTLYGKMDYRRRKTNGLAERTFQP